LEYPIVPTIVRYVVYKFEPEVRPKDECKNIGERYFLFANGMDSISGGTGCI
jgi:hypothetical protein